MFPKIIIFPSQTPKPFEVKFHDNIVSKGFTPLVDAFHGTDSQWLQKQLDAGNCALFYVNDDDTIELSFSIDEFTTPTFLISYNVCDVITSDNWDFLEKYFNCIYSNVEYPAPIKYEELLEKAIFSAENITDNELVTVDLDDDYHFVEKSIDEMDIKLFEIKKPNTPVPYTIVVRNFRLVGYIPVFTSLFIMDSWGVNRYDAMFLKHLWDHLKLDGEFDLDALLKTHTEKCYPGNASGSTWLEPEVYRKTILETEEFIMKKFVAKQCKRRKLDV